MGVQELVMNDPPCQASPPPTRSAVTASMGVMGGWSPASVPPRAFAIPPANSSPTYWPHSGWRRCMPRVPFRSNPRGSGAS